MDVRRFCVALLMVMVPLCSWAADRVLIMAIGDYASITKLDGVKFDVQSAMHLARKLGYDTRQAMVLKDAQLTGPGIRKALGELVQSVKPNDRVFVYYSGHGYSLEAGGQCRQGLVAQDFDPALGFAEGNQGLLSTQEINGHLSSLKSRLHEALIIFDACHSGGNRDIASAARGATLSSGPVRPQVRAKAFTPAAGQDCSQPVNELKKSFAVEPRVTRGVLNPETGFTFIAAANEREVALDDGQSGGLATTALLKCAQQDIATTTGQVTAADWVACAQKLVNQGVAGINARSRDVAFVPHTLELYGNQSRTMNLHGANPQTAAAAPVLGQATNAKLTVQAYRVLERNSDVNWLFQPLVLRRNLAPRADGTLELQPADLLEQDQTEHAVKMGDVYTVGFRSNRPGYMQIFYVGSDGTDIRRHFPSKQSFIKVDAADGADLYRARIDPPAGSNVFLAVLSEHPVDLSPYLAGESGLTSAQRIGCMTEALKSAQSASGGSRNSVVIDETIPCRTRNSTVIDEEAAAPGIRGTYAARVFTIRGQ